MALKKEQMKKTTLFILLFIFILWNCEDAPDFSTPKDSTPPGAISNPIVENVNGGAIITYTLPSDNDLLGVKARYSFTDDGEALEMFASKYKDTIRLRGFPDTEKRSVTLSAIDRSFNESAPVEVTINPLTPPINLIKESSQIIPAFGGINIKWDNQYEENIAVSIYAEDSLGNMLYRDTYYSELSKDAHAFRGFDAVATRFRIEMRDRWENYAEPMEFTLTPYFEEEILPKDPITREYLWDIAYGAFDESRSWRGGVLATGLTGEDGWISALNSGARHSWGLMVDGDFSMSNNRWATFFKPQIAHYYPDYDDTKHYFDQAYFIFDLKKEVVPSRLKFWAWPGMVTFPNEIEVWGTLSTPKGPDDFTDMKASLNYWTSWNAPPYVEGTDGWNEDWTKLGTIQIRPTPSGAYEVADWTQEDLERRDRGFELDVDPDVIGSKVRYLRFVFIKTQHEQCYVKEIKLWGQYVE